MQAVIIAMYIILLGPPGSGKGTQAELISQEYSIPSISTGELLRNIAKEDTELGRRVKSIIVTGSLIDNDTMIKVLEERLSKDDCKNGYILDGFPRSLEQAKLMEHITKKYSNGQWKVVNIAVPEDILIKRLSGRYSCAECGQLYNKYYAPTKISGVCDKCGSTKFIHREDDNEATVKHRLKVYEEQTKPLINFYTHSDIKFKSFDGAQQPKVLFKEIKQYLDTK
jgi:adenylate kinase